MDGMLSQEEINALLNGMGTTSEDKTELETLSDAEKDALGEMSNISMGTAATTLSSLVNQRVDITTPQVSYATWEDLVNSYDRPCVFIQIFYKQGLDGSNILVLKQKDVQIITDLMMGGDGSKIEGEITDLHLSAIGEAMNQMMGSAATSISSLLEKKIDISPPNASLVDLNEFKAGDIGDFLKDRFVKVSFHMEIGNLVDSELMQLYPFEFAKDLYQQFMKYTTESSKSADSDISNSSNTAAPEEPMNVPNSGTAPVSQPTAQMPQMAPNMMPQMNPGMQQMAPNMSQMAPQMAPNMMQMNPNMMQQPVNPAMFQNVNIAPAQFQPFSQMGSPLLQTENIDLLLDVPLEITVELGRTSKSIKEILDFAPGTIIELNRLAGEPIDVLVNGKYVAKGEVVVIEEAFGIRVTEIVK